jgi:hypothetical protein
MVRAALLASAKWKPSSCRSASHRFALKASSPLFTRAEAGHVVEQPLSLVAEKYASSTRPVFAGSALSLLDQLFAEGGIGGGLPDDGVMTVPPGTVPQHRRFALVGDADGGHVGCTRWLSRVIIWCTPCEASPADFSGVMSTQPGWGKSGGTAALACGRPACRTWRANWWCPDQQHVFGHGLVVRIRGKQARSHKARAFRQRRQKLHDYRTSFRSPYTYQAIVSPFGFSFAAFPWGVGPTDTSIRSTFGLSWARTLFSRPAAARAMTRSISRPGLSDGGLRRFFSAVMVVATFFHHSWGYLIVGNCCLSASTPRGPGQVELDCRRIRSHVS